MIQYRKFHSDAVAPKRGSDSDVGYELCSLSNSSVWGTQRKEIRTGISIYLPEGFFGKIVVKEELAKNFGINVIGGLVKSKCEDEIKFILVNQGDKPFDIQSGQPLAELVIQEFFEAEFHQVTEFI